jgi:hypothetical protein
MSTIYQVRCPNCGSPAERHHVTDRQLMRTQCSTCDYLIIICTATDRVIEAYAPGISAQHLRMPALSRP